MTTIKLKNGSGAPTSGDLVQGEPALDLTNKRLYTEDSGGTVIEVGTNPTSITTGDITATGTASFANLATTGNITFGDNDKAVFGAGSDLQIYHSGSHSFISEAGTGDLYIGASSNIALMNSAFSENKLLATTDGALKLYYDGSQKLSTTSTGIDVTGTVVADGLESSGGLTFTAADGIDISGKESVVVRIDSDDNDAGRVFQVLSGPSASQEILIQASEDAGVSLYYDNAAKLATTSTGIDVTGTATTDGLIVDTAIATSTASFRATTNSTTIGQKIGSLDFFNGTTNAAGTLEVRRASGGNAYSDMALMASANGNRSNQLLLSTNGDISFYEDTGTTAKLFWDASAESLGIGTSSPSQELHLRQTSGDCNLLIDSANGASQVFFGDDESVNVGSIRYDHASNYMRFSTNSAERMRIDASGNLLVGKTSVGLASTGFQALASGNQSAFVSDGDRALILNRQTSDGSVLEFRKDGSTVGSIGCDSNSNFMLGQGDTGLSFQPSSDRIIPRNTDGSGRDAAIDLGGTGNRFKDLYLSGYAYAGVLKTDASIESESNLTFLVPNVGEAARIEQNTGNLLVGKTGTSFGTAGVEASASNGLWSTRSSLPPLALNRLSSDGSIVDFYKDGTSVGSIGANGGRPYFASGGCGVKLGGSDFTPVTSAGATSDNVVNLGSATARFKDLYLSGRVSAGAGSLGTPTFHCSGDTNTGINLPESDRIQFITGGSERARFDASGNLLVGTTSTLRSNKFHVNASNFVGGFNVTGGTGEALAFFSNGTVVGSVSVTGSATTYNTSSDQRLKDNIVDAPSASDDIDAIQVRSFDWKADGSHQKYGMVAQELQSVAPEAVTGDADSDDMMGVDYSKLVPMMLKEIQSLRARVAQLEGEN